ncbi:MAG: 5-methyltetrahydrofolate--homocysteine methyltransferase [Bacteroidales bacterium]|jgi:hypothetical protein|nr:5-methyltetrahydrofolate--homocysteine methyltransferase [Bacteroidales bacterium]
MEYPFIVTQNCSCSDLEINMDDLYLLLGYGNNQPDGLILDMIRQVLSELSTFCKPMFGYCIFSSSGKEKDHIRIGNAKLRTGRIVTSSLRESEKIAVFTATIGKGFDQWNKLMKEKKDMMNLYLADCLGSVLVEACVSKMMLQLEADMMRYDMKISNNYSPGYCNWPLTDQKELFSLVPEKFCGITLTDSCLMQPIKSVSGIVGIGSQMVKRPYGCAICDMTECIRKKYS